MLVNVIILQRLLYQAFAKQSRYKWKSIFVLLPNQNLLDCVPNNFDDIFLGDILLNIIFTFIIMQSCNMYLCRYSLMVKIAFTNGN